MFKYLLILAFFSLLSLNAMKEEESQVRMSVGTQLNRESSYLDSGLKLDEINCNLVPLNKIDRFDIIKQREALNDYQIDPNNYSKVFVYSNPSTTKNPTAFLYLRDYASEYSHEMYNAFIKNGFAAVAEFDPFSSASSENSGTQHHIPTSTEIIMVYELCKKLKDLGYDRIVIGGHAERANIALKCASRKNAEIFRNVGVKGYVTFNPMPIQMEKLTKEEPVIIFTGTHDTVCPANFVRYYYEEYLKKQKNVYFKEYPYGHSPFAVKTPTKLQSICDLFTGLLPHKGWRQTLSNNAKNIWVRVLCGKSELEYEDISQEPNFTNACVVIKKDGFRHLFIRQGEFILTKTKPFNKYKNFLNEHVKNGVVRTELIQTPEAAEKRLEEMLSYMFSALKIYEIT